MIDMAQKTEVKAKEIEKLAKDLDIAIAVFQKICLSIQDKCLRNGVTEIEDLPDEFFPLEGITSAMKRMRGLSESNLLLMSDLELSAAIRFVFEMSLWVSFLAGPIENGKRYFAISVLENQRYLKKEIKYMEYEVANMRAADALKDTSLRELAEKGVMTGRTGVFEEEIKKIWLDNEVIAAKTFSIYSDWVKGGNFGTIADYIETKALPDLNHLLTSVDARLLSLKNSGVNVSRIKTETLAEMAGMVPEYEWIFSYTSRKIHAEPFSISGDFSVLTNHEKFIYVQYFLRKVNEILATSYEVFKRRKEFPNRF
ncbi:MAG: hypothetical protein H7240_10660 [Glaciimonas sp.]|nr:hypothetical protein [Glaciimonas sp.]